MSLQQKQIFGRNNFRERWVRSTDTPLRFFVQLLFVIEGPLTIVFIAGLKYSLDKTILLWIFFRQSGWVLLL